MKRDVYDLYLEGSNNIVKHSIACIPNLKCSMMVRKLFDDSESPIVECKYNEKFEKCQVYMFQFIVINIRFGNSMTKLN